MPTKRSRGFDLVSRRDLEVAAAPTAKTRSTLPLLPCPRKRISVVAQEAAQPRTRSRHPFSKPLSDRATCVPTDPARKLGLSSQCNMARIMLRAVLLTLAAPAPALVHIAPAATMQPIHRPKTVREVSLTETFDAVENLVQTGGPAAAYVAVAVCDSIPLVPTQPLTIAAGAAFGLGPGLAIVVSGQTSAAAFCFVVGRTVLGPKKVEALFGGRFSSVASQFASGDGKDSFSTAMRTVILLRQSPVIPFSVGNYVLGATDAPIPALMLGTVIGCLPLNMFYTATGAIVRGGAKAFLDSVGLNLEDVESILGVVGVAATAGIVYFLAKAIRQTEEISN